MELEYSNVGEKKKANSKCKFTEALASSTIDVGCKSLSEFKWPIDELCTPLLPWGGKLGNVYFKWKNKSN